MNSLQDHLAVGFPHSEIHGSKGARPSPRLIAACHVLHRLSVPRHPPDALIALDRLLIEIRAQGKPPQRLFLKTQWKSVRSNQRGPTSRISILGHTNLFTMSNNKGPGVKPNPGIGFSCQEDDRR